MEKRELPAVQLRAAVPAAGDISLPTVVARIIERLEAAGFEAYAVGGCVRDSLLGRLPEDWDITTSARPEEVKRIFPRCIDTGIEHGTVTVLMNGDNTLTDEVRGYELTTYRLDGKYSDGRHPDSVAFTPSLAEDLARRDFTINAMAYNPRRGLKDLFGGREDLARRVIRAVGEPEKRFTEDALRMLRALRFAAQLDFELDGPTLEAVRALAPRMALVSKERIAAELGKLLLSPAPQKLSAVFESGLAPYISGHFACLGETALPCLSARLVPKKYLRWAALLRARPQLASVILRELKLDKETIRLASRMAELLNHRPEPAPYALRRGMADYGRELYLDYLEAWECLAQDGAGREGLRQAKAILARGECVSMQELALSGDDLLAAGMSGGPGLGRTLEAMLDEVLREPSRNNRVYLLQRYAAQTSGESPEAAGPQPV